jgi:hypothetical protein
LAEVRSPEGVAGGDSVIVGGLDMLKFMVHALGLCLIYSGQTRLTTRSNYWSTCRSTVVKTENGMRRNVRDEKANPTARPARKSGIKSVRSVRKREPYSKRYKICIIFVCIVTSNQETCV